MRRTIASGAILFIAAIVGFNPCNTNSSNSQGATQQDSTQKVIAGGKYLATHAACITYYPF